MVPIGRLAGRVALAALIGALAAGPLAAQALQRLTVDAFTLTADAPHPLVNVPFHLTVTLRVRQRVARIDTVNLPMLAQLELLGDERIVQSTPNGTVYRETIELVAHQPGDVAVSPAVLQAVDARDGKPKAFSTNGLTLHVAESPADVLARQARTAQSVARFVLHLAIWIAGVLCVAALIALVLRRHPQRPVPVAAEQPLEIPPSYDSLRRQRLADGITVLRAEPTRAAAVRVRRAIWNLLDAPEGTTLAELLRRHAAAGEQTHAVLRALERAAFTYDADVPAAIADACDAMQRALET